MQAYILIYAGLAGFTLAVVIVSVFELISGRRLEFRVRRDLEAALLPLAFAFRLFGGPLLLARYALSTTLAVAWPERVALGLGAMLWSLFLGISLIG